MMKYKIIVIVVMGIEVLVVKEVCVLGYECEVDNGKVIFEGDEFVIVCCNLWFCIVD